MQTTRIKMLCFIKQILYTVILYLNIGTIIQTSYANKKDDGNVYINTCKGQLQQTPAEQRELRCRYADNGVPFCRIAPFKVEELSLDPYVAYYHESIYDKEIEYIRNDSSGKLVRSKVSFTGDAAEISNMRRTSQNTVIRTEQHDFLNKLERRLEDMTGLSLKTAYALQVINYEKGEYYTPHLDAIQWEEEDLIKGNRILTIVLYISDVDLGGATAFPLLNLAVQPIRRSMLMWYNLYRSLSVDFRTLHASCPVLNGSKWILTKMFHTYGQEFRRRCDIKADHLKKKNLK